MQGGSELAQRKVAEITHQTLSMLMFVILMVAVFVLLPSYRSEYVPVLTKLSGAAILGIVLATSYVGMDDATSALGEEDPSGPIAQQVFYNYVLNAGLLVFMVFLVYTCL